MARSHRLHIVTVRRWRKRFHLEGMAALDDRRRPGRPRRYGPEVDLAIVSTVTSAKPAPDSQWTHKSIAKSLAVDDRHAGPLASPPHQARTAGHTERREFECRRHGTASIVAALDVHTGQVLVEDIARNDSVTFIRFLQLLDRSIDAALTIHLVLDNGSSHVSKATRAWLAAHPRFTVHHTPKHASWLNQVEIFFSIPARRLLRRGEFTSRQDLIDQIREFTLDYDNEARRFRWTYDGTPLKAT
ncbi:IS630 family transposase [Streptomyces sp. NPDC088246]|uniref:IS630 family transposase n=1 Tax=Streptomyces sp. NPDC088246 TaxID=3365842 RepID=UPI003816B457